MKRNVLMLTLCLGVLLLASPLWGADVALFADTNYIGYDSTFTDEGDEGSNLQATLEDLGHTVTPFTGTSTSAWSAALAGADVLAIPEQEVSGVSPDLDAGAITAIQNFVNGGGSLLVIDDYEDFLQDIFGFNLSNDYNTGPWNIVTANVAGTPFAGGPATLPNNDATEDYLISNLPSGSICMYDITGVTNPGCAVFCVPQGSGRICVLAYDWYDAEPVGGQDGGWVTVLGRTMQYLSKEQKNRITTVPTMTEWGMIIFMVIAGIGAIYYLRKREEQKVKTLFV